MKLFVLLPCVIAMLHAYSFASSEQTTILHKDLTEVNSRWKVEDPAGTIAIEALSKLPEKKTVGNSIALHLSLVEVILSERSVRHLPSAQKEKRRRLLAELREYANAGTFPINTHKPYRVPIFIDDVGTHCAVGYLMKQSGYGDLATRINHNQRFAYVFEIVEPGVSEWAEEHGLSIEELAWIQPGYPAESWPACLGNGINGVVNVLASYRHTVYAAGSFTVVAPDGIEGRNIAKIEANLRGSAWEPLGSGCNGAIRIILPTKDKVYIGGDFTEVGGIAASHVAVYDIASGQWDPLGNISAPVSTIWQYEGVLYALGSFPENILYFDGRDWQEFLPAKDITGRINAVALYDDVFVVGGDFSLASDSTIRNVVGFDATSLIPISTNALPVPINALAEASGKLYAGCTPNMNEDSTSITLAVLDEGRLWQRVFGEEPDEGIGMYSYNVRGTIHQLISDGVLLHGSGGLSVSAGMYWGNTVFSYNPATGIGRDRGVKAHMETNCPIYTIARVSWGLAVAGDVASGCYYNGRIQDVRCIRGVFGIYNLPMSVEEEEPPVAYSVFPNPATEKLQIRGLEPMSKPVVYDIYGRQYTLPFAPASQELDISSLKAGVYIFRDSENGQSTGKFVKY